MKLALISLFVGSAAAFSAVSDSPPYILRLCLRDFGSLLEVVAQRTRKLRRNDARREEVPVPKQTRAWWAVVLVYRAYVAFLWNISVLVDKMA